MAEGSEQATIICTHCDRDIPSSNIDLHYAHCSRNLEKCKECGDMVPRKYAEEHFLSTHAPGCLMNRAAQFLTQIFNNSQLDSVSCSLCSQIMGREDLAVHKGQNCPQRIVTCEYCEFPLPAVDLSEHQEVCGNRTELCNVCSRYVRLRERSNHESRCNGVPNIPAESSRHTREAERGRDPQRRRAPQEFSPKHLMFTIAITGVAVLLGSLLFQRKTEDTSVH